MRRVIEWKHASFRASGYSENDLAVLYHADLPGDPVAEIGVNTASGYTVLRQYSYPWLE